MIINHPKVYSCQEASVARGITIEKELKTILLKICEYTVAVHLRGSDALNSKELRKFFRCKRCSFLSNSDLKKWGLNKGLINPWNTNFCHYHLLCKKVFTNDIMATNNSKLDQGVLFDVYELLNNSNIIIGRFGKSK